MRTQPPVRPNREHDHEWVPADLDEPFVLEDGDAIFMYSCQWAPVLSSQHSEKHDETFYEHGEQCDASVSVPLSPHPSAVQSVLETLENAWRNDRGSVDVLEIEPPDPRDESGRVVIQYGEHVVEYTES